MNCREHSFETSGSTEEGKFLKQLGDYQLKMDSVKMVNHDHNGTVFSSSTYLFYFKQIYDILIKYSVYFIFYLNIVMLTCLLQNNSRSFTVFRTCRPNRF